MNYRSMLIVGLATLGLAVAGWGQADGKIAFISDREGYGDVWIMNADGSDPVNLTQGRHCASPAWSPDGTQIAYIAGGEIWLMDADGNNPQQVTDNAVDKVRLWWSKDGSSIYYVAVPTWPLPDEWDGPDAFVTALDGSGSSPVDWREVYRRFLPGVSPDGTHLEAVTLLAEGPRRISVLFFHSSATDMHPALLLPDPLHNKLAYTEPYKFWRTFPTFSPDGLRIAFAGFLDYIGQFEIWATNTAETVYRRWGTQVELTDLVELTNGLGGHSPAWQPAIPAATSVEAQTWGRIKSLLSH
jgi:Tol biopolymer transport system component